MIKICIIWNHLFSIIIIKTLINAYLSFVGNYEPTILVGIVWNIQQDHYNLPLNDQYQRHDHILHQQTDSSRNSFER